MSYCVSNFKGTEDRDLYISACLKTKIHLTHACDDAQCIRQMRHTEILSCPFVEIEVLRRHIFSQAVANGAAVKTVLGYLLTPYSQNTTHGEMNRFLMTKTTREMRVVLKYYLNNSLQLLFNENPKILSSKNHL